jgi:LIVCS family branched-chain amino acid:cation transporter
MISFAAKFFPFFGLGFGWLSFGIAGLALGLIIHFAKERMASPAISED